MRYEEIIIGSGPNAATYVANRSLPKEQMLVIEAGPKLGGAFASTEPLFWMNSRNIPYDGKPQIPGTGASLNYLPGCPCQAEGISNEEYQSNKIMAYIARLNINDCAQSLTDAPVVDICPIGNGRFAVQTKDGGYKNYANRVLLFTGLGKPNRMPGTCSLNEVNAGTYKSVAVIGGGDTGKTAIEYFHGQGPTTKCRSEHTTWFGVVCTDRNDWRAEARPRYARIANLLPDFDDDRTYYVSPVRSKVLGVMDNCCVTNGKVYGPFDLIVDATGYTPDLSFLGALDTSSQYVYGDDGIPIARKLCEHEIYIGGPAADLPFTSAEYGPIPVDLSDSENKVAIWRYAPKSQSLAMAMNQSLAPAMSGQFA